MRHPFLNPIQQIQQAVPDSISEAMIAIDKVKIRSIAQKKPPQNTYLTKHKYSIAYYI